jgi:hypothetical protein
VSVASHRRSRILSLAMPILVVATFSLVSAWTVAIAQQDGVSQLAHDCGSDAHRPDRAREALAAPAQPISLTPEGDLEIEIQFNRGRGFRTYDEYILLYFGDESPDPAVFPSGTFVEADFSVFYRTSDRFEVSPTSHVVYNGQASGRGVNLAVCFNANDVPPGRYQSTVVLADPMLQHSPIPVVVTISEDNELLMVFLAFMGAVGATAVLWFQAWLSRKKEGKSMPFWNLDSGWLPYALLPLGFGAGAVVGVFNASYFGAKAFGGQGIQYFQFMIACGVAFAGASVLGSVASEGVQTIRSDTDTESTDKDKDKEGQSEGVHDAKDA